jgi:hypothetical protein
VRFSTAQAKKPFEPLLMRGLRTAAIYINIFIACDKPVSISSLE